MRLRCVSCRKHFAGEGHRWLCDCCSPSKSEAMRIVSRESRRLDKAIAQARQASK